MSAAAAIVISAAIIGGAILAAACVVAAGLPDKLIMVAVKYPPTGEDHGKKEVSGGCGCECDRGTGGSDAEQTSDTRHPAE